jgi:CubicO group peptidase (beta-lactamase class C family)
MFPALFLLAGAMLLAGLRPAPSPASLDRIFAKYTVATPGCAVAASVNGQQTLAKAYGLADLEQDVPNTPDTIFEAGSVSKQFTAAAVLLLARDGKLSLDDPARKYLPELPEYTAPITIRQMLTHTSGLRDWGSVEDIAGWPRGTRVYTQAHVLDILGRQRALNFTPGTRWSYCNSGYNLAAMIVARVSGMSFSEFTRTRLFVPLGMSHTSWRDDHTRIVKHRAIAYGEQQDGFHTMMPFEDVYGNSSLLTTVGDLLRWNEHFNAPSPKIADSAFARAEETPGKFADGRAHNYGLGLMINRYKGLDEIAHDGATAGYRASLLRYPAPHVSVAVLCNVDSATAGQYAHHVADLLLADQLKPEPPPTPTHTLTSGEIDAVAGLYRPTRTGPTLRLTKDAEAPTLRLEFANGKFPLYAMSATAFVTAGGEKVDMVAQGQLRLTDRFGTVDMFQPVPEVTPASLPMEALHRLLGVYTSDEAEATFTVMMSDDHKSLVIARRPDVKLPLTPLYPDAFTSPDLGLVIFHHDGNGRVVDLSVSQGRVWELTFIRTVGPASGQYGTHGERE